MQTGSIQLWQPHFKGSCFFLPELHTRSLPQHKILKPLIALVLHGRLNSRYIIKEMDVASLRQQRHIAAVEAICRNRVKRCASNTSRSTAKGTLRRNPDTKLGTARLKHLKFTTWLQRQVNFKITHTWVSKGAAALDNTLQTRAAEQDSYFREFRISLLRAPKGWA